METAMTVAISRQDLSAADLRQAARTQEATVAHRMLAIALVLEGCSRAEAAETCAMDRQTLRDWVHRYNASGLDGLSDQPRRNGPQPHLLRDPGWGNFEVHEFLDKPSHEIMPEIANALDKAAVGDLF